MDQVSVPLDHVEQATVHALRRHGATVEIAGHVARAVRVAEAKDNKICGLYYLESYCKQLSTGRVLGNVVPEVFNPRPGSVRVDAKFGFAQPAFAAGFDTAVAAAKINGTCGFAIEHSHTCTSLGYFTEQLAEVGLIALGFTNSSARVAPPGGTKRLLGTNPMAMAVPARDGGIAFQFDFSTSAIALGKITMAAAAGDPIPLGWAVDADGNDTTDPKAALEGSMLSAGGHKGYGLGLMVEVLAAALTASTMSVDIAPLKTPDGPHHDIGQFYLLIDPASYSGESFWDSIEALSSQLDDEPDARLPGSGGELPDVVVIDTGVWDSTLALTGGNI